MEGLDGFQIIDHKKTRKDKKSREVNDHEKHTLSHREEIRRFWISKAVVMIANMGACTQIRMDAPLNRARTPSLFTVDLSMLKNEVFIFAPFAACTRVFSTSIGVTRR